MLDVLPSLAHGTVDTHHPENQLSEHTLDCISNKIIGTYKLLQVSQTANLLGAIMIRHLQDDDCNLGY